MGENANKKIDAEKLLSDVFKQMGTKPETIIVPNVLLLKGDGITIYSAPNISKSYLTFEEAKKENPGKSVYKVDIEKVE